MSDLLTDTKLFRVGLYVAALLASFGYVFWKVFTVSRASKGIFVKYLLVPIIGVVSMIVVWRNIMMFMMGMVKDYPDLKMMLKESDVIVEAYRVVTDSVEGYWWSSQLFMFAMVYIVFLNTKSRQISMSTPEICAYTWLAFSGAVSLSFALFIYRYNATLNTETRRVEHHQMSGWSFAVLAICLWLSYICILFLYYSVDSAFKVYLLAFHIILLLPSFLPSVHVRGYTTQASKGLVPFLYALLVAALTSQHLYFTHLAMPYSDPKTFYNLLLAGFYHYSQCAVSLNAVFCFIICVVYLLLRSDNLTSNTVLIVVPFVLFTPCISLGAAFSLVMFYEEYNLERETEVKED